MATIDVKDAVGATQTVAKVENTGRVAEVDSLPVAISDEDKAVLDAIAASVAAPGLPTGGATAARQDTGNTSLAAIDTKLGSALPLSTGAATAARQDTGNTSLSAIDTKLGAALPLPTGAATSAAQTTGNASLSAIDSKLGAALPLPTGAATETSVAAAASGIGATGDAAATAGSTGSLSAKMRLVTSQLAAPALPSGAATETTLSTASTQIGSTSETAASSDTATSGLSGRLQRIAQRITSLIALLPASLGTKTASASLSVTPASDAAYSPGAPKVTSVTIVSLQTNATGATYNAFASQACTALDVVNTATAAADLEFRRGGSGSTIVVPSGSARMFVGITNASDLQARRLDQSNTQVTFTAEAMT